MFYRGHFSGDAKICQLAGFGEIAAGMKCVYCVDDTPIAFQERALYQSDILITEWSMIRDMVSRTAGKILGPTCRSGQGRYLL